MNKNNLINLNSNNVFFKNNNFNIKYFEFKERVTKVSASLKDLKKDDLVLLSIEDRVDFFTLCMAIMNKGAIPCLLNPFFNKDQIKTILKKNKFSYIVSDKKLLKLEDLPQLTWSVSSTTEIFSVSLESKIVFFSSGTIEPKAIVHTLSNFFENAKASYANIPFSSKEIWGQSLPHFHVGGFSIFIRAILKFGSIFLFEKNKDLMEQVSKCDYVSLVSTQFFRLIEEIKKKKAKLKIKTILLGGSPIPIHILKEALDLGLKIKKSYGMTEAASQICTTDYIKENNMESSGKTLPHLEIKIDNSNIYVRGKSLFLGYLVNNNIQSVLTNDGWFDTKDYGVINHLNEIIVLGRRDRIFQTGGENISPEYIESKILQDSRCMRCKVVPIPDKEYGMRAVAYVEITTKDLSQFAIDMKKNLNGFNYPKEFKSYSELNTQSWKDI